MPVTINILENGTGIEFISSGVVTGKDIIQANQKIYIPEYLSRLKYKIIDRTTCTDYLVTSEEMRTISNQDIEASKINRNITIILVTPTKLQYGMTRMWQAFTEITGWKSKIFENREIGNEYIKKI